MLKIILAPLVGGVIGYITNDLAIKMLFRPRKAVYIGKLRLPFTPGLIPRQKPRIAASIGEVISHELLDPVTLEETLLSDAVMEAVSEKLDEIFASLQSEQRTLRDKLSDYFGVEKVAHYEAYACSKGARYLSDKLAAADAGTTVMRAVMDSLKEKLGIGLLARFMDEMMIQHVGAKLNRMIEQKGPTYIAAEIGRLDEELLGQPIDALYETYEDKIALFKERLLQLYRFAIAQKLKDVLSVLNIQQIIVDKINAFSAEELETLIFSIMKQELRSIVYLGALLGFLMGFINLLW